MTLDELIAQFRIDTVDQVAPYLSSDAQITYWLDEAQEEAALRANLLMETSNADVCQIAVTAGTATYALHESVLTVTYAYFIPTGSTSRYALEVVDRIELTRRSGDWRATSGNVPLYLIVDDTSVTLADTPSTNGVIYLECYRSPLDSLEISQAPEINRAHHRHLLQWAMYKCYSRPDADLFNPKKSEIALAEFTRIFGLRPDAGLRREYQANLPLFNKAVW